MNACVIIPARYKSTRLPGKPLVNLLGKPMVLWVCEASAKAVGMDNVFVATDDRRIMDVVHMAGFKFIQTSNNAITGTDRVAEAALGLDYDIYVNVQGDEPLVDPNDILEAITQKKRYPNYIINGFTDISSNEDPSSLNIPKVIINESGMLVYISRALIPGYKKFVDKPKCYKKQVCIYAFCLEELKDFHIFGRKSELENMEDIEILRFLEIDYSIKMFRCNSHSLAVDVTSDIHPVEEALKRRLL